MKICKAGLLIAFMSFLMFCKQPFQPEVTRINSNILVVEGLINTGGDSTIVKLSRTVVIDKKNTIAPETNAVVTVESDANETYPLINKSNGNYEALPLPLSNSKKYRLRIRTANGTTYLSDFVTAKVTPPIDDITFEIKDGGLQIYANAHDDTDNTRYYRWDYYDTWEFSTAYYSRYKVTGATNVTLRNLPSEDISTCYTSSFSSNIILGSTIKLNKDIAKNMPLQFIPAGSEKISLKYTTLVRQYALTKEAFDFWDNLRKNTETLGSIFDAQPSQLTGNIHNVANSAEPVIGYISAGTVQKKRIFIAKNELPDEWKSVYPYNCGRIDTVGALGYRSYFEKGDYVPLDQAYNETTGQFLGMKVALRYCADCTVRGAVKKPAFWQ